MFQVIYHDMLKIVAECNFPFCLVGDFNAWTKDLEDKLAIEPAEYLFDKQTLKSIYQAQSVIPERSNSDTSEPNENGHNLINLCKSSDILFANGRVGQDGSGEATCIQRGNERFHTVDYVLASSSIFSRLNDLKVDQYDEIYSDRHRPIHLQITMNFDSNDNTSNHPTSNIVRNFDDVINETCTDQHDEHLTVLKL